jgi:hypothetical protein
MKAAIENHVTTTWSVLHPFSKEDQAAMAAIRQAGDLCLQSPSQNLPDQCFRFEQFGHTLALNGGGLRMNRECNRYSNHGPTFFRTVGFCWLNMALAMAA